LRETVKPGAQSDNVFAQMSEGAEVVTDQHLGPAELVLAASVARRYYLDGRTKIEIGDEFQLSRFKVARLLDTARTRGLVRIEISHPGSVNLTLSEKLRDTFHLDHAVVIDAADTHEATLRSQLGRTAAELLTEITTREDVLGLAWARAVGAMATQLQSLPNIPVVQLTGALYRSTAASSPVDDDNSIDVVREVARVARGPAYLFYAPFMVRDAATAKAMRQQPEVARALEQIASVTKAVFGVGCWEPGQSTLYDSATAADRRSLTQQGVCADVGGVFVAADGTPLQTSLSDRMIGINAAQLLAVDQVLVIPYGLKKRPAVLAAIRSGLVSSIVTHASLASALLDGDGDTGRSAGSGRPAD
jgi:DNA-binding transcriptional regulator LsrR (DeoR family)